MIPNYDPHPRTRPVIWQAVAPEDRALEHYVIYAAQVDGEKWELRLNDFPAEPLYTLFISAEELMSFSQFPACWTRP